MIRRYTAGLSCLAALALAGCSAVAQAQAGARMTPSVSASASASSDDLRPALLAPTDLPQGYVPVAAASNGTGTVSIGGGGFPGCPALEPMTGEHTTAAAVTYSRGGLGPYLTDALVRFPPGAAAEAMRGLAGAAAACHAFSQRLAGITVRFTVAAVQLPATLGDQAVGLRMTGTTDLPIAVSADIVAIRRGDLVLWLNDMTVGATPAGLAGTLAQTAVDRCVRYARGC